MTKNGTISHFVTPAKAGVQASQGFFNGLLGLKAGLFGPARTSSPDIHPSVLSLGPVEA